MEGVCVSEVGFIKPNESYRKGLCCYWIVFVVPVIQRAQYLVSERSGNPSSANITYIKLGKQLNSESLVPYLFKKNKSNNSSR